MLKLSRFAYIFDNNKQNHIALFHAVNLSTIFLERNISNLLNSLKIGIDECQLLGDEWQIVDSLMQSGYIVNSKDPEISVINAIKDQLKPKLSVLYLILTDKCNLKCKYCFIEAGFPTNYICSSMTWDIAK
jgi:uncharacterized protein